jgi:hypothetical protein
MANECGTSKNLDYPDRTNSAKELVYQGWINRRRTVHDFVTDGYEYK